MKVLLLNPTYPFEEWPTPPFGLMSLAAYLVEKGLNVRIEDYIVTPCTKKHIQSVLNEYNPDVVGATGVTMNINTALSVLKDYKRENPDIRTLMGGPHVTFDADNILRDNSHVDFIVRGEGELTCVELLENISSRSSLTHIKGISYRQDGRIVHNETRPFIKDINILPYPARDLAPISKYRALTFPINMVTSRGCPYQCIFCVGRKMMGGRVRYFDVDRVVDEFEMLSTMGFKQINIVDDLFTSNKGRCIAICDEIIRRGISHPWTAFARVNTVSKVLLEKMREAGCVMLCFGIESGNQEILDTIKKKTTLDEIRKAINLCIDVGIESMGSYILGLPGESHETINKTFQFAAELNPIYGFHILAPFPGTEVRDRSEEYGIRILTEDWDKYDANHSVSETPYISHEEIDQIVDKFNSDIEQAISNKESKRDPNKPLSKEDIDFIETQEIFHFSKELVLTELVEKYPGLQNGRDPNATIDDFLLFLEKNTNFTKEEAKGKLKRLLSLNCLKIEDTEGKMSIAWA